jgi:hypothetical protein
MTFITSDKITETVKNLTPGTTVTVKDRVWFEPVASNGSNKDAQTERDIILALTSAGLVDVKKVSSTNLDGSHEEVQVM